MESFKQFENDLQEGLGHLYDPLYEAPASLWSTLGVGPEQGVGELQRG